MSTLYDITADFLELQERLLDPDGCVDQAIADTMQGLALEWREKVEGCAKVLRHLESRAKAFADESKRMSAKAAAATNACARLKQYVQEQMEAVGVDRVEGDLLTVAFQANPPRVVVDDIDIVPPDYLVPQPSTVDKRAVLERIKAGGSIPGVHVEQSRSLRVR